MDIYQVINKQLVPVSSDNNDNEDNGKVWIKHVDKIPENESEYLGLIKEVPEGGFIVSDQNFGKLATLTSSNVYSLEEKVVGKWIDGRPIYQRTWSEKGKFLNNKVLAEGISDIISQFGNYSQQADFSFRYPLPYSTTVYIRAQINNNHQLVVYNNSSGSETMYAITVQYCKVADLPQEEQLALIQAREAAKVATLETKKEIMVEGYTVPESSEPYPKTQEEVDILVSNLATLPLYPEGYNIED